MNRDGPPPDLADMIKYCGALVVYAVFALPFLQALYSGSLLGAFMILWIAHIIAGILFPR
jgi:hypothetical protein